MEVIMRKLLYSNPITSSLLINIGSAVIAIKSINSDQYWLLSPIVLTYILNKKIITNGVNLNKAKKITLCLIYFIMVSICFLLNKYIR